MKNKMSSALLGLATALVLSQSVNAQEATKLGFIDINKAVDGTADGKKANDELQKVFKQRQDELKKAETDIAARRDDFTKKEMVMADEVKARKRMEIEQEFLKLQKQGMTYQQEIQKKEMDLKKPILDAMKKIIDEMAKREKFTMIFNSQQGIVWARNDLDITEKVIGEYEKSKKGKK